MRILVTGGAGFIGSNFVRRRLAATDDSIIVVDKLTYAGNPANLAGLADDPATSGRYRFVQADIADEPQMRELAAEVDAIVNAANSDLILGAGVAGAIGVGVLAGKIAPEGKASWRGVSPRDLVEPLLGALRGIEPIAVSYTRSRSSGYGRLAGADVGFAYFVGWERLLGYMTSSPTQNPVAFSVMLGTTVLMFGDPVMFLPGCIQRIDMDSGIGKIA